MLNPEEMGLFRERIRLMDRKIQPGLTKLQWSSMGSSSAFIQDSLLHVDMVGTHSSPLTDVVMCTLLFLLYELFVFRFLTVL